MYLCDKIEQPAVVVTIVIVVIPTIVVVVIIQIVVIIVKVIVIVVLRIGWYTIPIYHHHPSSWKVACSWILGWYKSTDIIKNFVGFYIVSCWIYFVYNLSFLLQINTVPEGSNNTKNASLPIIRWNWEEIWVPVWPPISKRYYAISTDLHASASE